MIRSLCRGGLLALTFSATLGGQEPEPRQPDPAAPVQQDQDGGIVRFRLPTITVTAQREPEDVQESPASVTAVTSAMLEESGARTVSEAAQYAPNTFFTEFTARKVSNPRFRGLGASPTNPGVVTYIDGVPQLHASSSSIELAGIEQIEFVRGPQSTLFGRNALGGVVNITSVRPPLGAWTGSLSAPWGNFGWADVRGSIAGPVLTDVLSIGIAGGYSERDGFSTNTVTGHDLDSRSAAFGKVQVRWTPAPAWEVRAIVSGERARDGDYALSDLGALRDEPLRASHDVEGFTRRDLVAPTLIVTRAGRGIDFAATTGFVWWRTRDVTDLDYSALPLFTRDNRERDRQLTQELRLASARNAPILLADGVRLKWQGGLFVFSQDYAQDAVNRFAPFVLSPLLPVAVDQHSPDAALDDRGVGVYGEATATFGGRFDATAGARVDREHKEARLNTFTSPAIAPPSAVAPERDFTDVSPQFTAAYRVAPRRTVYATAARGYKAGGFNPASPAGAEAFGEEHSWSYEGGVKTSWLAERLAVNAAVFYLRWRDLQVNLPNPLVPQQFYIDNAGRASSKGAEVELHALPAAGLTLFGSLGYTNARFGAASVSNGLEVAGNRLANTPDYTANAGVQYSQEISASAVLYGRGEIVGVGRFQHDDANTQAQEGFSLVHFRAGIRVKRLSAEAWVRNAFDTRYVAVALPSPGLAPSGFIGENGPPRTFGVRAGWSF
jgi:iron complex outermembrane receptor protein